jgi:hypothetical protein
MQLRKTVIIGLIVAFAGGNMIAPRLSHAARHPQAMEMVQAATAARHHQQGHHHDHALAEDANTVRCHGADTADHAKFQPEHNCCLAACAAMAFIFAASDVARHLPSDDFNWPPTRILRPSALAAIDHPPRNA